MNYSKYPGIRHPGIGGLGLQPLWAPLPRPLRARRPTDPRKESSADTTTASAASTSRAASRRASRLDDSRAAVCLGGRRRGMAEALPDPRTVRATSCVSGRGFVANGDRRRRDGGGYRVCPFRHPRLCCDLCGHSRACCVLHCRAGCYACLYARGHVAQSMHV